MLDKINYLDGGYFIFQDEKLIGGVILKPNFMTDLFMIAPYESYEIILQDALNILVSNSDKSKIIKIDEVPERYKSYYFDANIRVSESWKWMIRPTDNIELSLPKGYKSKEVEGINEDLIAELLCQSYRKNTCYESYYTKEDFLSSVKSQIQYKKSNNQIYSSSRVLICERSNELIGIILMMEDEGLPLITDIVIREDHKRKGLASYLIQYSINALSNSYSAIRLSVNCENAAFILYKKIGFVDTNSLINYEYCVSDIINNA